MPSKTALCRLLALCALTLALGHGAIARAASIAIVLSEAQGPYQEFSDTLRVELRREPQTHDFVVLDAEQAAARNFNDVQFVVGVGSRAMEVLSAKEFKAPLLLTLITRSAYEKTLAARRDDRKTSGLFIDHPPSRYIDLVRAALPEAERIGFLAGRDSREHIARLVQVARERKFKPEVESISTESEIFPAIQRLFPDGGVLLATPDASIFNTLTIPNIILSAYRFRVPVVGFSQGAVRSGAMIALFSTPAHLGVQSAELVSKTLAGAALPPPQSPRLFSVGINAAVARSLNISLASEAVIQERMERLYRQDRP